MCVQSVPKRHETCLPIPRLTSIVSVTQRRSLRRIAFVTMSAAHISFLPQEPPSGGMHFQQDSSHSTKSLQWQFLAHTPHRENKDNRQTLASERRRAQGHQAGVHSNRPHILSNTRQYDSTRGAQGILSSGAHSPLTRVS